MLQFLIRWLDADYSPFVIHALNFFQCFGQYSLFFFFFLEKNPLLPKWIHPEQYTGGNSVELLYSGKSFFDALEVCIQRAHQTLWVQVYILNPDETGRWVLGLLRGAVGRGVRVSLLLDAYGSRELGRQWVEEIREAGIEFRFFGRLFSKNLSIGRRLHHKLVVADGTEMLIGGINLADRYNEIRGQSAWLDFAVYLRGPLAAHAQQRCTQIWARRRWARLRPLPTNKYGVLARLSANDWLRGQQEISSRLRYAIRHARQELFIGAAYFVPTAWMLFELRKAARRGVRIRLLLGRYSDVGMALRAARFLYDWILRQGIEIYEFNGGILHAKVFVADKCWVSVGSYNLNYLSAFTSLELNLDIADTNFGQYVAGELEKILQIRCERIDINTHSQRQSLFDRIGNALAFFLLWATARMLSCFHRKDRQG